MTMTNAQFPIFNVQFSKKKKYPRKAYYAESTIPFVVNRMGTEEGQEEHGNVWSHYSAYQIEVAARCIPSARVGFNTAELLDFIVGWTTIDILNDDIGNKENEIEETEVISE